MNGNYMHLENTRRSPSELSSENSTTTCAEKQAVKIEFMT